MIISYMAHERWQIDPGKVVVIGTDNQTVYSDLITGINFENEHLLILDDQYNAQNSNKLINWVGDLINYNFNHPLEAAIRKIVKGLNEQQINQLRVSEEQLFNEVQNCLFMSNLPLQVHKDGDLLKTFKYCGVDFSAYVLKQPYAIIEALINIQIETGDDRVIALTNVAHYLRPDQIEELSLLCKNTEITLILVEFTALTLQYRYPNCDFYHIDEDFVDWHAN